MARARNIKPGFFQNEDLVDLDPLTRIMFIGLWIIADRSGRLENRPKRIKMQILPADDYDLIEGLKDLERINMIQFYGKDDKYIQIVNFEKHQNPHKNERPSTIPAPEQHGASTVQALDKHSGTRADSHDSHDSHDSLNPFSPNIPPHAGIEAFDEFWRSYPRKVGKVKAKESWKKHTKGVDPQRILKALDDYKASDGWNSDGGKFIPHPATWINQERWDDEIPPPNRGNGNGQDRPRSAVERVERATAQRAAERAAGRERDGRAMAENGEDVRPPLDGVFRRIG